MILSRSSNSYTSIKTYASQQSGVFIIKCYFGISNIATYRQKMSSVGSLINNRCPIIFHCAKNAFLIGFSVTIFKPEILN